MTDEAARGAEILRYLAYDADREEKLLENQEFIKTPIVRNRKEAPVGYAPEVWGAWE
jgi:arsenate reductase-like glutaredoxin family protein